MISIGCYKGTLLINDDGTIFADVPAETIAHGLANVSRFGGQTVKPYSDAEHSVRLAWLLKQQGYEPIFQVAALIHDAPEAFGVGDVNTFIKRQYGLEGLRKLDYDMTCALWKLFFPSVPWNRVEAPVHMFDKWIGHFEAECFSFTIPVDLKFDANRYGDTRLFVPDFWSHEWAKEIWLDEWNHLLGSIPSSSTLKLGPVAI